MIRFLTDEDFNNVILNGIKRCIPNLDIVRAQDVGLRTSRDPAVLEFAAAENRILLSHDTSTMETHARARILAGKPMSGIFLIRQNFPIGRAIEEIVTIAVCSRDNEWNGRIEYLPL